MHKYGRCGDIQSGEAAPIRNSPSALPHRAGGATCSRLCWVCVAGVLRRQAGAHASPYCTPQRHSRIHTRRRGSRRPGRPTRRLSPAAGPGTSASARQAAASVARRSLNMLGPCWPSAALPRPCRSPHANHIGAQLLDARKHLATLGGGHVARMENDHLSVLRRDLLFAASSQSTPPLQ